MKKITILAFSLIFVLWGTVLIADNWQWWYGSRGINGDLKVTGDVFIDGNLDAGAITIDGETVTITGNVNLPSGDWTTYGNITHYINSVQRWAISDTAGYAATSSNARARIFAGLNYAPDLDPWKIGLHVNSSPATTAGSTQNMVGIAGTAWGTTTSPSIGVYAAATGRSVGTGAYYGMYAKSIATHPGGTNYGIYATASGGTTNYAAFLDGRQWIRNNAVSTYDNLNAIHTFLDEYKSLTLESSHVSGSANNLVMLAEQDGDTCGGDSRILVGTECGLGSHEIVFNSGITGDWMRFNIGPYDSTTVIDADSAAGLVPYFIFGTRYHNDKYVFRGNAYNNLFFIDGHWDKIGVGTATPEHLLDVRGGLHGDSLSVGDGNTTSATQITFDNGGAANVELKKYYDVWGLHAAYALSPIVAYQFDMGYQIGGMGAQSNAGPYLFSITHGDTQTASLIIGYTDNLDDLAGFTSLHSYKIDWYDSNLYVRRFTAADTVDLLVLDGSTSAVFTGSVRPGLWASSPCDGATTLGWQGAGTSTGMPCYCGASGACLDARINDGSSCGF